MSGSLFFTGSIVSHSGFRMLRQCFHQFNPLGLFFRSNLAAELTDMNSLTPHIHFVQITEAYLQVLIRQQVIINISFLD